MSEWQTYKLKDVTTKIGSGATPTGGSGAYKAEGISLIRSQNVLDYKFTDDGLAFIDNDQAHALRNVVVEANDVLLNITGDSVARCCSAPINWLPARVNQHVAILRSNPTVMDNIFLKYALLASKEELLILSEIGGTRNALTKGMLENFEIQLPLLPEQKAIASVLSSLDDKIDLLHRQNKTLEAMAETLFRQWFIEEASEDWEEVTLADVVESANTGLDAIRRAPIVEVDTGIKCLRIQDISQCKPFRLWGNSQVLEKDFQKAQLRSGDLIMARTCSPGIVYLCREDLPAVFNNGLAKIRPNLSKTYSLFLYYLFKSEEFIGHIYGISDGTSVQLNMKLGDLLSYKLRFPSKTRQNEIYPIFHSINEKQFYNIKQIQTLEQLRDTLLPKLMSGEVRVQYQTEQIA